MNLRLFDLGHRPCLESYESFEMTFVLLYASIFFMKLTH